MVCESKIRHPDSPLAEPEGLMLIIVQHACTATTWGPLEFESSMHAICMHGLIQSAYTHSHDRTYKSYKVTINVQANMTVVLGFKHIVRALIRWFHRQFVRNPKNSWARFTNQCTEVDGTASQKHSISFLWWSQAKVNEQSAVPIWLMIMWTVDNKASCFRDFLRTRFSPTKMDTSGGKVWEHSAL